MKRLVVIAGLLFVIIALAACGGGSNETKDLSGIEAHFEGAGLKVADEREEKIYQMIGAVDGLGLDVNETAIELYEFEHGADELKNAKENNSLAGMPAHFNGNLAMIVHGDSGEGDEIIEAFQSY